jgi:high-affinity Fe2+/Pb2+ permease
MRQVIIILTIILTLIGLTLSILPFGSIAFIPIIAAFVLGLVAFRLLQKEGKKTGIIKIIFAVIIISLGLAIYNALKPNEVSVNNQTLEKQKQQDQETLEELEDIEIDD